LPTFLNLSTATRKGPASFPWPGNFACCSTRRRSLGLLDGRIVVDDERRLRHRIDGRLGRIMMTRPRRDQHRADAEPMASGALDLPVVLRDVEILQPAATAASTCDGRCACTLVAGMAACCRGAAIERPVPLRSRLDVAERLLDGVAGLQRARDPWPHHLHELHQLLGAVGRALAQVGSAPACS